MAIYSDDQVLQNCKSWISEFVIKLALCPFAKTSYYDDRIAYRLSSEVTPRAVLEDLYALCEKLLAEANISNSFLILPQVSAFEDMLVLQDVINTFLDDAELCEHFQIVVFHPEFTFEGEDIDDAGNYVNRSPYPMLHILRVDEVAHALTYLEDPHSIPIANREKLEKLGSKTLATALKSYQH